MSKTDKRCGTCRYIKPTGDDTKHGNWCVYPLISHLPEWAKVAIDGAENEVDPREGSWCATWEARK